MECFFVSYSYWVKMSKISGLFLWFNDSFWFLMFSRGFILKFPFLAWSFAFKLIPGTKLLYWRGLYITLEDYWDGLSSSICSREIRTVGVLEENESWISALSIRKILGGSNYYYYSSSASSWIEEFFLICFSQFSWINYIFYLSFIFRNSSRYAVKFSYQGYNF